MRCPRESLLKCHFGVEAHAIPKFASPSTMAAPIHCGPQMYIFCLIVNGAGRPSGFVQLIRRGDPSMHNELTGACGENCSVKVIGVVSGGAGIAPGKN